MASVPFYPVSLVILNANWVFVRSLAKIRFKKLSEKSIELTTN